MAYLDNGRSRPSATSIGGALAINGLMIAGIVFAAPDILPPINWTTLTAYPVDPDPAPPPPSPEQPVEQKRDHAVTASARPPVAPESADSGLTAKSTGIDNFLTGTGDGTVIPEPPIKIEPVFKGAQVNPRYAGALQPSYPPGMIREEREGIVTVRVLIGTDGRVKSVEALRADDAQFLEATRKQALSKWRFLPATRDGSPIESWREMTVRFQLPD